MKESLVEFMKRKRKEDFGNEPITGLMLNLAMDRWQQEYYGNGKVKVLPDGRVI